MMKNKSFDCVEMKHQAAAKVQAQLAGMSDQEKIAFFRKIGDEFRMKQVVQLERQNSNMLSIGNDSSSS